MKRDRHIGVQEDMVPWVMAMVSAYAPLTFALGLGILIVLSGRDAHEGLALLGVSISLAAFLAAVPLTRIVRLGGSSVTLRTIVAEHDLAYDRISSVVPFNWWGPRAPFLALLSARSSQGARRHFVVCSGGSQLQQLRQLVGSASGR